MSREYSVKSFELTHISHHTIQVYFTVNLTDIFFGSRRFVVVCGDGEYIIYTAMALRNKSFGSALEFVWSHDSSE